MTKIHAPTTNGIIGIAAGLMVVFSFTLQKLQSAPPTIKVPGAYPYEDSVRIPAPPPMISESSVLPTPAPFPYPESAPSQIVAQNHDSRNETPPRPVSAKAVREAAFKCNGVPDFWEFLAALPANVSVFDPKLGTIRPVVQGTRVIRKNVAWLHQRQQARSDSNDRTVVSIEELASGVPGI